MSSARPGLAYVVNSLHPGGTEKLVVEMSLAFAAEFDLRVFCLDEPGLWAERLRVRGIPVYSLWRQPGLDVDIPVKLARHFRQQRTQIVHAHQCTPWFYAALARLLYPTSRLLLEEHGRFFPEVENRKRAWFNRWIIKPLTHCVVAVSEDVRERLRCYEGLQHQAIAVVYNGVAPEPLLNTATRTALRREWGFTPEDFVVGTVGRCDSIKNLPLLVNSLARAGAEAPNIRGLLVGDGPDFAATHALIERLKLTNRILLTGFRDDARTLVQCMDLFVLSSFSEGTSMALLEAMAAGVPVAVTAVGGNPEVVIKGQTGWVAPSDSVEALTAAMLEAVSDPEKRRVFARAGQQRFEECFNFGRMIETYRQIYRDILARAG